jgi:hypothetical protein
MPIVVPVAACDPHRNRNRVPPPRRRPHALKRIHALSGWRRHQHTTVQQCHPDLKTRFYGSRRFTEWLNKLGHGVNRKHVQRLMLLMGIEAIYQKPNISKPAQVAVHQCRRMRLGLVRTGYRFWLSRYWTSSAWRLAIK